MREANERTTSSITTKLNYNNQSPSHHPKFGQVAYRLAPMAIARGARKMLIAHVGFANFFDPWP